MATKTPRKVTSSILDDFAENLLIRQAKFDLTDAHKQKIQQRLPEFPVSDGFWEDIRDAVELYKSSLAFAEKHPKTNFKDWHDELGACLSSVENVIAKMQEVPPAAFAFGDGSREVLLEHARSLASGLRRRKRVSDANGRPTETFSTKLIEKFAKAWVTHGQKQVSRSPNRGEFPDFCVAIIEGAELVGFPRGRIDSVAKSILASGKKQAKS